MGGKWKAAGGDFLTLTAEAMVANDTGPDVLVHLLPFSCHNVQDQPTCVKWAPIQGLHGFMNQL